MTEGDMDELSQRLAGEDVSAEEMKERLDKTEVTQHEEEALVEITELFKEMESVEGEERRKTSESIVQAAKRWPDKVAKHSEQLVDFVTDDNYYVRKNATFALGLVGDERHVEFLEKVAEKDDDLEDVARWSAKRIRTENEDDAEASTGTAGEGGDVLETQETGVEERAEVEEEQETGVSDGVSGDRSLSGDVDDENRDEVEETVETVETSSPESSSLDVSDSGRSSESRGSGDDESESVSTEGGESLARSSARSSSSTTSSSVSGGSDGGDLYRDIAMTLYDQGDGHREAVEQAAVQVVSRNGSLQPLVEALDGEGDEPLFAARTLARISKKDPGSLRENVSVLSDLMSRKDGEVSSKLEETLVNVARETPESLVEELSKRN